MAADGVMLCEGCDRCRDFHEGIKAVLRLVRVKRDLRSRHTEEAFIKALHHEATRRAVELMIT
jgi:hypothetical protein